MSRVVQQVNLYHPRFRKETKAFIFTTLLQILGLAVSMMALLGAYGYWQKQSLQEQLAQLQQQHSQLQGKVAEMRNLLPEPDVGESFEQELQRLQIERTTGYQLLNTLEGRLADEPTDFSAYFEGLARQSEPRIWFETVELSREREYLALKGKVTSPEILPQFLQKLGNESAFRNRSFRVVHMAREDADDDALSFDLRTDNARVE